MRSISRSMSCAAVAISAACSAVATSGPDVIVGDLQAIQNWGAIGTLASYSPGLVQCNIGDAPLLVQQMSLLHPVQTANIFRHRQTDGVSAIEQIGMGWVFHNFCALQQTLCGTCIPAGGGCVSALGVGCSDPHTAARCGTQNNLGPRYSIDAATGDYSMIPPAPPISTLPGSLLGKRVMLTITDLDLALNPGASYYAEQVSVAPDDAAAGNNGNNASHRRINIGALMGTAPNQFYSLTMQGATTRELPALAAWRVNDPSVTLLNLDVSDDGRFVVGYDVTNLGGGQWHYEYAIFNLSSHRSGQAFSVPVPDGVTVTNIGFHDIDYHTQQILAPEYQVDNLDWTAMVSAGRGGGDGSITWATTPYSGPAPGGNEYTANALRWATMYNFRFDADAPPAAAPAALAFFRPGVPEAMSFQVAGPTGKPGCAPDLSGDGAVNGLDLAKHGAPAQSAPIPARPTSTAATASTASTWRCCSPHGGRAEPRRCHAAAQTLNFPLWLRKRWGFSKEIAAIVRGEWPRRRISCCALGTANGSLWPQSPAELIHSRSVPYCSMMSAARCGVHLVSGYSVIPAQNPWSSTSFTVCSST
jgi:hypothetical protein